MAKLPSKAHLQAINAEMGDIAGKLDRISSLSDDWDTKLVKQLERQRDLNQEISDLQSVKAKLGKLDDEQEAGLIKMQKEVGKLGSAWTKVAKIIGGQVFDAVDKLGKGIIDLGLGLFEMGLQKLAQGITKVYELHEKWAKLMGEFRNKLGVTTKNLGAMSKVAAEVEGTMHGLTGQFGLGAPMVNEFIEGLGRVETTTGGGTKALADLIKTGTFASRVLGIGAGEAGELTHTMQQLAEGTGEQKDAFLSMSAGAKAAGVSTAKFSKDVVQSKEFMASFGKDGRKVFMNLVTFANKLGVSMKSIQAFTKMTDTFDSTAESVAKLNTVFGTTINSLDLMLEQDPSKRLETVRQSLLAQGKTYDQLSRQERGFLAETMKVTEEELAGVLQRGKTLDQVQADAEKAKKDQEKSQKNMAMLINKTATTLFSFSAAWDKVTKAIEKLIAPFTKALGLTADFDKHGKRLNSTFGGTMTKVFDRLIKFINEVAANPEWQKFMKTLADDAKGLAKHISDIATGPGLGKWIHNVTTGATDFYNMMKKAFEWITKTVEKLMPAFEWILKHLETILKVWLTFKAAMAVVKVGKGLTDMVELLRGASGGAGGLGALASLKKFTGIGMPGLGVGEGMKGAGYAGASSKMGMLGKGAMGAGIGAGAGALGGAAFEAAGGEFQHGTQADIGSIIGGSIGMIFGPVGAAVGGLIGKFGGEFLGRLGDKLGDWISDIRTFEYKEEDAAKAARLEAEAAERKLSEAVLARTKQEEQFRTQMGARDKVLQRRESQKAETDDVLLGLQKEMAVTHKKALPLEEDDRAALVARIESMNKLGIKNEGLSKTLETLKGKGDLTKDSIEAIQKSSDVYNKTLQDLNAAAEIMSEKDSKREDRLYGIKKDQLQKSVDDADKELKAREEAAKRLKTMTFTVDWTEKSLNELVKTGELSEDEKRKAMKGDLSRDKVSEMVQQRMAAKADIAFREAQTKKAKAALELEGIEKDHQKKMQQIQMRAAIMTSTEFQEFRKGLPAGTDLEQAFGKFVDAGEAVKIVGGTVDEAKALKRQTKEAQPAEPTPKAAAGGVVTRATKVIAGEAGPEAIIPLKNFAGTGSKGGQQPMRVVAGDVYLDGAKVGRHIVRQLVQDQGE